MRSIFRLAFANFAPLSSFYASSTPRTSSSSTIVQLTSGTFQGLSLGAPNNTDSWLGIPFAQPPVGNLRFKAPVPIASPAPGVKNATEFGNACPQIPSDTLGAPMSEDCLSLNVWRPSGTTVQDKLPVLVWIFGGSFTTGAASQPIFNPTRMINRSANISKPIIFVSINYRVNTFGFLASSHVQVQDLNAGLLDQRAALAFIHENVAAFGGDPNKVTIWGQSAGAGSAEAHVLFPTKQPLFRAAIWDSSTGPFKSAPPASTYDQPGKPYAELMQMTGCTNESSSFDCLQNLPYGALLNASNHLTASRVNGQLWQPAIGPAGSFASVEPSQQIASGNFLHVPVLAGTNLNEGTIFSQSVLGLSVPPSEESAVLDTFIQSLLVDPSTVTNDTFDTINKLYPVNDSSLGGAYNTGDSLFDRSEAWYTDNMFLAPRRLFFDAAAVHQPLFAYFFTEFIPGEDVTLGVSHGSELAMFFGFFAPVELEFANQMTDFYINFVYDLNPGDPWPQYTPKNGSVLQLMRNNVTVIADDFLFDKTNFENTPTVLAQMQK